MKNLILLFALLLGFSLPSCNSTKKTVEESTSPPTQEKVSPRTPDQRAARDDRRQQNQQELFTKLNLSEKQIEQFEAISATYRGKMKNLRDANRGDREAMRTAMRTIRTEQDGEIKKIMTESQFELYTVLMKERRKNRRRSPRQ